MSYMPPKNWEYYGDASAFHLKVRDAASAEVDIKIFPVKWPLRLDEANVKSFDKVALEALSPGATAAVIENTTFNPIEVDGHKTAEVLMHYRFFGQNIRASLLFAVLESGTNQFRTNSISPDGQDRDGTLLIFRVTAPAADFEKVPRLF